MELSERDNFRKNRLFLILGAVFLSNALLAEFIGVKIFSLERTLGYLPARIRLWGDEYAFNMTAGVLLWPVVFVLTDIINEYYGKRGVRLLSFLAAGIIIYSFGVVYGAMALVPADFWPGSKAESGVPDFSLAYNAVFGQGLWIIIGSLTAFLIGQFVDVTVFHFFKNLTGQRAIWLRATGSTLISQLIDSFVVLIVAFYIGAGWPLKLVLAIGIVNYIYKFTLAVLLTPVLYVVHAIIDRYLGKELSQRLMEEARNW